MLDHTWTRDAVRRLRGHPVQGVQIPRHRAFSPGPAHGPGPLLRGVPRAPSHAYHHMGGIDRKRNLRRRLLQAAQGRPKTTGKAKGHRRQLHRRPRQRQRGRQRQRENPKERKPKERKSKERKAQGVQPRAKAMAVQERARPSAKTTTRPLQGAKAPSRRKGWAKERR